MYGQKQILQCLAVALILAVFNFHRAVIKRSKSNPKMQIRRPGEIRTKIHQIDNDYMQNTLNANLTGYCMRYPFGSNIYGNHDVDYRCHSICFDKFETWLRQQCKLNCCVHKDVAINKRSIVLRKQAKAISAMTRNCENGLMKYASLQHNRCALVKTIMNPHNENLMNKNYNKPLNQYECKIQTRNELICTNTTSLSIHQTEPSEAYHTGVNMEYNDFLFDGRSNEQKYGPSKHQDTGTSMVLGIFTFVAFMITIQCLFKLLMNNHAERYSQAMEIRRNVQDRLERMVLELETRDQLARVEPIQNSISIKDEESSNVLKTEQSNLIEGDETEDSSQTADE